MLASVQELIVECLKSGWLHGWQLDEIGWPKDDAGFPEGLDSFRPSPYGDVPNYSWRVGREQLIERMSHRWGRDAVLAILLETETP